MMLFALAGCETTNHKTDVMKAPSVSQIKQNVSAAKEANDKTKISIDKTSDYAKRIDGKTSILLEHWDKINK